MGPTDEPRFDPRALTRAQRQGDACVACRKRWPRPRVRVGRVPDGSGVFACADCAPALPTLGARHAPPATGVARPVATPASARAAVVT
ncbi:hypothetical protein GCM10009678_28410 [Actinomadura kijaniata]|uniref:Uncharacterized protein n=1 Tax=Actinomadura namibiensis TaxID=182080 RepID=A0A7W3LJS7_ACTNM|nr:hypothetical protein [Actinomadura kijaniata]MBA8949444.1 hypothetical protein [Actinomadura namibiensis]